MADSKSPGLLLAVILLLSFSMLLAESTRIKILTHHPAHSDGSRLPRQATSTACDDNVAIERSSLNLTGPLSMLNERVRFYRSDTATQGIDALLSAHTVVGLNVTAAIVVDTLRASGCLSYAFGGVVRDQFLGTPSSNDIDMEVDCSIETVVDVCRREWGEGVCGEDDNRSITHIGKRHHPLALDLASTEMTFYGPLTSLEYTANALAYDLNGRRIVLDLPRNGVEDVCARRIRIPSDDGSRSSWDAWATETKIYRYWKLRFKGFTAVNNATSAYIVTEAMTHIDLDRGLHFKQFYCEKVFEDSSYSTASNTCRATSEACSSGRETAARYDMLLVEDMGEGYVQELVLPTCRATTSEPTSNSATPTTNSLILFVGLLSLACTQL